MIRHCRISLLAYFLVFATVLTLSVTLAIDRQGPSGSTNKRKWTLFVAFDQNKNHDHRRANAPPVRGGYTQVRKSRRQPPSSYSLYSTQPTSSSIMKQSSPLQHIRLHDSQDEVVQKTQTRTATSKEAASETRMAKTVSLAYFCTAIAVNLPIVLMPTIAGEIANSAKESTFVPATFIASVAAAVSMGGGLGKLVNGAVCQVLGGRRSMAIYMMGISIVSLVFSFCNNKSPQLFGGILSLMEFMWSIQWTASSVVLANHYTSNAAQFSAAITRLSLMSTAGTILSKVGGTALLSVTSWAVVARVGALAALLGAARIAFGGIDPALSDGEKKSRAWRIHPFGQSTSQQSASLVDSFGKALGNPAFWLIGFAYSSVFLARTSDRVLGSFYVHVSGLSKSLCGGLTTSCTVGFAHGLGRGRVFHRLPNKATKLRFLKHNYTTAVVATLGLAICGSSWLIQLIGFPVIRAAVVALLSGIATSCLSFQFYQLPSMFANEFGTNKVRALFHATENPTTYCHS